MWPKESTKRTESLGLSEQQEQKLYPTPYIQSTNTFSTTSTHSYKILLSSRELGKLLSYSLPAAFDSSGGTPPSQFQKEIAHLKKLFHW